MPHAKPVVGGPETDEADVDLAPDQRVDLIGGRHIAKMELDVRMRTAKALHHVGQQPEDAGDTEANAKEPGFASRRPLRESQGGGGLGNQMTAAAGEQSARLRQLHVAIAADQQRPSDPLFHAPDALAERRLRYVQALGRPAEVQGLGQNEQRLQILELDLHNNKLSEMGRMFHWTESHRRAILGRMGLHE